MVDTMVCKLIGHKFIGRIRIENKDGSVTTAKKFTDRCVRCGLSKKELKIGDINE